MDNPAKYNLFPFILVIQLFPVEATQIVMIN